RDVGTARRREGLLGSPAPCEFADPRFTGGVFNARAHPLTGFRRKLVVFLVADRGPAHELFPLSVKQILNHVLANALTATQVLHKKDVIDLRGTSGRKLDEAALAACFSQTVAKAAMNFGA